MDSCDRETLGSHDNDKLMPVHKEGGAVRFPKGGLCLLAVILTAGQHALADDVEAGVDLWKTPAGGSTKADFSEIPIPSRVFGVGAKPYSGIITFRGEPLFKPFEAGYPADTIVWRTERALLPVIPSEDTIPIEIVALNLVSVEPIVVHYSPGSPKSFKVVVNLSDGPQEQGRMTIHYLCTKGGNFDAVLPVRPKFTFINVENPLEEHTYDPALIAPDEGTVHFRTLNGRWSHIADPRFMIASVPDGTLVNGQPLPGGSSNFVAGVWPEDDGALPCWGQPPVVYSVDRSPNPAEGLLQPDPAHLPPNDVFALGPAPRAHHLPTEGEIFQSSGAILGGAPDMSNVDRIFAALGVGLTPGGPPYVGPFSPNPGALDPAQRRPGTLGLVSGDDINSASFGLGGGNVLVFSVNPLAVGLPGTAVNFEAILSGPVGALGQRPSRRTIEHRIQISYVSGITAEGRGS